MSDSHDRIESTSKVIKILKEKGSEILIHCGDLSAPFMMEELAKFSGEIHCVFGNVEDRFNNPLRAEKLGIKHHGDTAILNIDSKKILINHYPDIAKAFASTKEYDLVLYGHDHTQAKKIIGKTLLINPGGIWSRNHSRIEFALYDTKTNEVEFFKIE